MRKTKNAKAILERAWVEKDVRSERNVQLNGGRGIVS